MEVKSHLEMINFDIHPMKDTYKTLIVFESDSFDIQDDEQIKLFNLRENSNYPVYIVAQIIQTHCQTQTEKYS
jgi:hypothetical protein